LRDQGRFVDALAAFRRGDALGSKTPGWRFPSAALVRECQRLLDLDRDLPAILRGEKQAAGTAECLELASLCRRYKRLYRAAARFYAVAFAAAPKRAADLRQQHRYNAACSAALATAGQGEDGGQVPDEVRVELRRQALGWLRDDLAVYANLVEREEPAANKLVRQRLTHWLKDTDFGSVRDREALARLGDTERQAWRRLWDDVAALLKKVDEEK
jgi:hypothetical protein